MTVVLLAWLLESHTQWECAHSGKQEVLLGFKQNSIRIKQRTRVRGRGQRGGHDSTSRIALYGAARPDYEQSAHEEGEGVHPRDVENAVMPDFVRTLTLCLSKKN